MLRGFMGRHYAGKLFDTENGGAAGGGGASGEGQPANQGQGAPGNSQVPPPAGERTYTKAELEAELKAERAALAKQAADAAAVKNGEFEKLATERQAALDAQAAVLKAAQEQTAAYETVLQAQFDERLKKLPKAFQDLVGGANLAEKITMLGKVEVAAAEAAPKPPGTPPGPGAGGGGNAGAGVTGADDAIAQKRGNSDYGV